MTTGQPQLAPIGGLIEKVASWNPVRDAPEHELAYIDLSAVDNATKTVSDVQTLKGRDAPSRARQLVKSGDILVSTVRPNLNGVARVPEALDGATASTGFCVLRPTPSILDGSYLFHWVRSPDFVADMVRKATGASYPAVSDKIIGQSEIPLPPLREQKRISAILDQTDELRRKRQRAIDRINQLGQAIFIEMFGGGSSYESASLRSLGKVSTGSTPPTSDADSFGGSVPFVTPGDLGSSEAVKRTLTDSGAEKSRLVAPGATFVCCIGATIGKMGQAKERSAFNQQINAVEWGDRIDPTFGFYAVQQIRNVVIHKGKGASTTLPILKKSEFEKLEIVVPPMSEQQDFSKRLDLVQRVQTDASAHEDHLEVLFASLQHLAFHGEV